MLLVCAEYEEKNLNQLLFCLFVQNFAVELQAESQLDLDLEIFTDALNRAGGANYGTGVRDF